MNWINAINKRLFGNEQFDLNNLHKQEKYTAVKYTKSGQMSIFSSEFVNESNKDDINLLFNLADENHDGNLTFQELSNSIYHMVEFSTGDNLDICFDKLVSYLQEKV